MFPQIIMIALIFVSIGINLAKHGEERPAYNVWTSLIAAIISFMLLWWGGFFDVFWK